VGVGGGGGEILVKLKKKVFFKKSIFPIKKLWIRLGVPKCFFWMSINIG